VTSVPDRLFTARFFVMCGFTFTVFLSAFQLLPTAPFRIRNLGGTTFASGLFLGFLTYASALSAPLTGALADRIGRRRAMLIASAVITLCSVGYAATSSVRLMLALVVVHGMFWSGLLSASAACFGTAAVLSAIALPYFLLVDRKLQATTRVAIFAAACASRLLLW
jgi:MFS family permease